jgi:preprotein translocase subunit YajC
LNLLLTLLAQTTNPATQPAQPPGFIQYMPFIFLAVLMYFFLIKGRRNQDKQRNELLAKLKPGQRIQTIGGVLGTVTQVNEKEVTVKVDETNNVKIKFTRGAVHRVLDEEKTETK